MHKNSQTQLTVWWLLEGMGLEIIKGKRGKYMITEGDGDLTLNGKHTIQ